MNPLPKDRPILAKHYHRYYNDRNGAWERSSFPIWEQIVFDNEYIGSTRKEGVFVKVKGRWTPDLGEPSMTITACIREEDIIDWMELPH